MRVGEDPASKVYVGRKEKACAELGIVSETHVLPEKTSEAELLELIAKLNAASHLHGILVQAPLPKPIRESVIYSSVLPSKDVDGFNPVNVGKLMLGDDTGFKPCTPAGVVELLVRSGVKTDGAEVVILGRGNIVGKPMAAMLCQKGKTANSTVTICHSATRDIKAHCLRADIIIAAMGVAEFLKADMVKPGAAVLDVGGVGIELLCNPGTLATLRGGSTATLAASLVVREDSLTLFGFVDEDEKSLFVLLQTASGVGPKLAQAMLAVLSPDDLRRAVLGEDVRTLTKVPGIGQKGAQRIILELKDRIGPPSSAGAAAAVPVPAVDAEPVWRVQVREALVGLGWSSKEADKGIALAVPDEEAVPDVATVLRLALRAMSGR